MLEHHLSHHCHPSTQREALLALRYARSPSLDPLLAVHLLHGAHRTICSSAHGIVDLGLRIAQGPALVWCASSSSLMIFVILFSTDDAKEVICAYCCCDAQTGRAQEGGWPSQARATTPRAKSKAQNLEEREMGISGKEDMKGQSLTLLGSFMHPNSSSGNLTKYNSQIFNHDQT